MKSTVRDTGKYTVKVQCIVRESYMDITVRVC